MLRMLIRLAIFMSSFKVSAPELEVVMLGRLALFLAEWLAYNKCILSLLTGFVQIKLKTLLSETHVSNNLHPMTKKKNCIKL